MSYITIDWYLGQVSKLVRTRKTGSREFRDLIKGIEEETLLLSPVERSAILDRFFAIWDRKY